MGWVMAGELNDLSVAVGALQAQFDNLDRSVRENQRATIEEHRKVHDIVVALAESMRNVSRKVDKMEPVTDKFQMTIAEARGAAKLVKVVYIAGAALTGAAGAKLMDLFSLKPHP